MSAPQLHLQLEVQPPDRVAVGRGTAFFVAGWCFCPQRPIARLELLVEGRRQPLLAHGMPRLDPARALHPGTDPFLLMPDAGGPGPDPLLLSYRSGFWGLVQLGEGTVNAVELALIASFEDGGSVTEPLGRVEIAEAEPHLDASWPGQGEGPRVAICMATYNPPPELLRGQVASIRGQSHGNWICVVSDDCSDPSSFSATQAALEDDPRFLVSRSPKRLGFFRNFERALSLAPAEAEFVALADQDDVWRPDKLAVLLAEIGDAQLVFSDARVVSRSGEVKSDTWWDRRRNNHSDLLSVLVANSITGAASLFPRRLLDDALPFPPAQFAHFHDHWIGLVALALGRIAYVDRPLYDYVQHGGASLGHERANVIPASLWARLRGLRATQERVRMWRLHYFVDACRLLQLATILEQRCGGRMRPSKRRALRRFLAAERSPVSLAMLGLRGVRELIGTPETLGAEWMLFHAFAWRRLLDLTARARPSRRLRLDALPPPSLVLAPGRHAAPRPARALAEKIAPLSWSVSEQAPTRVNLLIPTIDLEHFFGGYIAKFNLARRLVERGMRVRLVTVDPVGALPPGWQATLESYRGLAGLFDQVEVAFGRESDGVEISRGDRFIATTWWTAHVAGEALAHIGAERFLYLIQEYEPFTFPMGSLAAVSAASYRLPHFALFSSELLREYFRRHRIGVFATGERAGDACSASFQNAITPVGVPEASELAGRNPRRLLFYARPEPHAARNMYELGALALSAAAGEGLFASGWRLHGIGSVSEEAELDLGHGATLSLVPRSDQRSYGEVLRRHDVGLALMYTPHPSLVPIEMASAGLVTVTNSFENKTQEAMAAISSNIIAAEPSLPGILEGLRQATARIDDFAGRVNGSAVHWSRDWNASFDDQLLRRLSTESW